MEQHNKTCAVLHTRLANEILSDLIKSRTDEISKTMECVICLDLVLDKRDPRFGLLNCEHCVCISCIRTWRTSDTVTTAKSCPICRSLTHFVVPSSIWVTDPAEKSSVVMEYKNKLQKIDCRAFGYGEGNCSFGSSCFYRHANREGIIIEDKIRKIVGNDEEVMIIKGVQLSAFLDNLT